MQDFIIKKKSNNHPLGRLEEFITGDGTFSLFSNYFKESFHSQEGALKEALNKYLSPSEIDTFNEKSVIMLDICVGLGYNSAALIETVKSSNLFLNWWGIELDKRPLRLALQKEVFRNSWSKETLSILEAIRDENSWQDESSKGNLIWGDARNAIKLLPKGDIFHLIMLDAFSPPKCPELWTEEFINALARILAPGGRIITYCTAAAIRGSLRRAGLRVKSVLPKTISRTNWSIGTLAIKPGGDYKNNPKQNNYRDLSQMEEEHLLTKAAIPYRDPDGMATTNEINKRREQEQRESQMESTSSWQRRWVKA